MVKARKKTEPDECIVDGCDLEIEARGLCKKHYGQCYAAIRSGETSWAALEKRGITIPKKKAGRKISSPITKAIRSFKKHR